MSISKTGSRTKIGGLGQYQYPSWGILEFCKTFPLGKTGEMINRTCLYYLQLHENQQLSEIFQYKKREYV